MEGMVIKKSKIHGSGVFASRDFKKGEVVVEWSSCSTPLTKAEVDKLSKIQKSFVSYLGKGVWVYFQSPGKYFNHSCEANTKAIKGCDVANRKIRKGEEITFDYIAEKVPVINLLCYCGTGGCRKILNPHKHRKK